MRPQDAQGEDVVAGIRTPEPIARLKDIMPAVYDELYSTVKNLEAYMGDMQVCTLIMNVQGRHAIVCPMLIRILVA